MLSHVVVNRDQGRVLSPHGVRCRLYRHAPGVGEKAPWVKKVSTMCNTHGYRRCGGVWCDFIRYRLSSECSPPLCVPPLFRPGTIDSLRPGDRVKEFDHSATW